MGPAGLDSNVRQSEHYFDKASISAEIEPAWEKSGAAGKKYLLHPIQLKVCSGLC
jgi:hypothetical protein